jgi:hypothetical protein
MFALALIETVVSFSHTLLARGLGQNLGPLIGIGNALFQRYQSIESTGVQAMAAYQNREP